VPPDLPDLDARGIIGQIPVLGIVLALAGSVFLAFGAQLQHRGVAAVEGDHEGERAGLSLRNVLRLLGQPSWLLGTAMLGLAIVLQLASFSVAPLVVVQPLGVAALVITSVVNARMTGVRLGTPAKRAIALCVGGIGAFVAVAAFVAQERVVEGVHLIVVLVIVGAVLVVSALVFALFRRRVGAMFYVIAAGVLYGLVATLAKVVINRIGNELGGIVHGEFEWLTVVCLVALVAAMALGGYFVQTAYSLGSPDLVIAGLTVVDPLVAVSIGIFVLGETATAPPWAIAAWLASGTVAVVGVFQLARHHPQTRR